MEPKIVGERTLCYLCGAALIPGENRTKDHVPPVGLFPSPLPDNLITVRACRDCNQGKSGDEEFFRMLVTIGIDKTRGAAQVYEQRTVRNTLATGRLRDRIGKLLTTLHGRVIRHKGLLRIAPCLEPDGELLRRITSNVARGIVAYANPGWQTHRLKFSSHIVTSPELLEAAVTLNLRYTFERGGDTFWCLYDRTPDGRAGACIMVFHCVLRAVVFFADPDFPLSGGRATK